MNATNIDIFFELCDNRLKIHTKRYFHLTIAFANMQTYSLLHRATAMHFHIGWKD